MIEYKNYYLKENCKKEFFDWCLEEKLYKENSLDFSSRMQLVFTEFVPTESITAVIAYENNQIAGMLLCENKLLFHKGKIYEDPEKTVPVEQESFDWGFYNLGIINIYVKPEHRNKGIAKSMVENLEKLRLNKLANIKSHWVENSKPLFEAQELSFDIASKTLKNTYVSTGKPQERYLYRQVIHSLSVKCKDITGCKKYNREDFKNIDLKIEEDFVKPAHNKKKYNY